MAATVRQLFTSRTAHKDDGASHGRSLSWRREIDTEARGRKLRDGSQDSMNTRPRVPQKDTPPDMERSVSDRDSSSTPTTSAEPAFVFRPGHLSRAGSVYSLSRVSFTSQISQLTAIHLPDASSLSNSIASIPTAEAAARTLKDAAGQIQLWMQKASDVLGGLDAGDDADWAAAAGREGVVEVDQAVQRFEGLVNIYVAAVEDVQLRKDAASVPAEYTKEIVEQVLGVTESWAKIKFTVDDIKRQVEVALEWEEMQDKVFGDITTEMDVLSTLVFEMEERRYRTTLESTKSPDKNLEIGDLETMINDPGFTIVDQMSQTSRSGVSEGLPSSPLQSPALANAAGDLSVLGLFARMQPLGASLDLLPKQLEKFKELASVLFPSACQDLETRKESLQYRWSRLEADAESLRKELGEDKWNAVFRNASRRALKMIDSIERSLTKVDESLENNTRLHHAPATLKKIEQYEGKKQHYCPAVDRVLNIVERGVKDRLTVNGEILRLRADLRQRWQSLQRDMTSMDGLLEEYAADVGFSQEQLRDSVSTILSNTGNSVNSSTLLTPGSSPPSSVELSRTGSFHEGSHDQGGKPRQLSAVLSTPLASPISKRISSLPLPISTRKTPLTRSTTFDRQSTSASLSSQLSSPASAFSRTSSKPTTPISNRPRWSYTNQAQDYDVSAYYRRLKSKGSSLHSSPRVPSVPVAPAAQNSSPSSRTPSRPPPTLRNKRSNIFPTSSSTATSSHVSALSNSHSPSTSTSTPQPRPRARTSTATMKPNHGHAASLGKDGGASRNPLPVPLPDASAAETQDATGSASCWSSPATPGADGGRSRGTSMGTGGMLG